MTPTQQAIVDAAFEVAHFSKTHEYPTPGSEEWFHFGTLLDRLATAINAEYPAFNRNIQTAAMQSAREGDGV